MSKMGWLPEGSLGRRALAIAAGIGLFAAGASQASAATYTVDAFNDPNSLACAPDPDPAPCSLRAAVKGARNSPIDEPVIKLLPGTYTLGPLPPDTGVPDNLTGDLDWADQGPEQLADLRIEGAGSALTTIDATGLNDRIFDFVFASVAVSINGVTFKSGRAATPADGGEGGAIRTSMDGPLFLSDVRFVDNTAPDNLAGNGGAIASYNDNLTLENVSFFQNRAAMFGGAIALARGPVVVPRLGITNASFDQNVALLGGGAIANFGDGGGPAPDPIATITNATFDGNKANGFGGAIDTYGNATTNLESVTLTRNRANDDNTGGEAGGALQNGGGTYTVRNSLIAANTVGTGGFNPDCSGAYNSLGGNILSSAAGCSGFAIAGDTVDNNPLIGPLSANGGLTPTVPLLPGSPAIDHSVGCPATDQRGLARPQGPACDTGAFEVAVANPSPADRTAPETTITAGPRTKVKTKKRKKAVSFRFISSEAGGSFQCKLDDRPFAACASPFDAKVKKGSHVFTVRAADATGNLDPTPATLSFKVKRKR